MMTFKRGEKVIVKQDGFDELGQYLYTDAKGMLVIRFYDNQVEHVPVSATKKLETPKDPGV